MKTCNKCNKQKPLDAFFNDKSNKTDGKYSICKACKQAGTMAWREANPEKYNAVQRTYNSANYYKLRLQRYKLTVQDHKAMLEKQNNRCALCDKLPEGTRPLGVDHDHVTGKVRGLLCYGCNRLMVLLDNPELLKRATAYKAAA